MIYTRRGSQSLLRQNVKMIVIIELKKYIPSTGIISVFICKPSYLQKFCLVILLKVGKGLEICFYYIILIFGLAINLKIGSNRNLALDSKKHVEQKSRF